MKIFIVIMLGQQTKVGINCWGVKGYFCIEQFKSRDNTTTLRITLIKISACIFEPCMSISIKNMGENASDCFIFLDRLQGIEYKFLIVISNRKFTMEYGVLNMERV